MDAFTAALPIIAAALAVPQFVPQLVRAIRTTDLAGLSWAWAVLTSVNNGAWTVNFVLADYWWALVPSISATVLAGALAVVIGRRRGVQRTTVLLVAAWVACLVMSGLVFGRIGLATTLTVAFVVQVVPSVWAAFRSRTTTGISLGTWALILGELACWGLFGVIHADLQLTTLGVTGVVASLLVIGRVTWARRRMRVAERIPVSNR